MINFKINSVKFYQSNFILAIFTICINVFSAFCNFWTIKANPFFLSEISPILGVMPLCKNLEKIFLAGYLKKKLSKKLET